MLSGIRLSVAFLLLAYFLGCGSSGSNTSNSNGNSGGVTPTPPSSTLPQHIVVIIFENQDYVDVIGNPAMPFFNRLATQYGLATQFYANTHPSIGNYFFLTTGENPTNNDDSYNGTFSGDNVARQLAAAGKTWKVYAESLPSVGYTGEDVYPYIKHHNPFAYLTDVIGTAQAANIVPFSQFTTDLNNNSLPSYALVVPDNLHNGHDCSNGGQTCPASEHLANIDSWLSANFSGPMQNASFVQNSVLILTFDESATDNRNGGGRIPTVLAGGPIKAGYQSTTMYQIPSLLKFTLNTLGVSNVPGSGANAPGMAEFLK